MKEDLKDIIIMIALSVLIWFISSWMSNPIFIWMIKWILRIAAAGMMFLSVVSIFNLIKTTIKKK